MATPLRQEGQEQYYIENHLQSSAYHDFQEINQRSVRQKELLFFTRISIFSLLTSIISLVFLAFNLSAFLALPLALLISWAATSIGYYFLIGLHNQS